MRETTHETHAARQCVTVYLLSDGDYLKIGYTSRSIEARIRELQTGSPRPIQLLGTIPNAGMDVERELQAKFANLRIRSNGEWFMASPAIEAEFRKRREAFDAEFRNEQEKRREEAERKKRTQEEFKRKRKEQEQKREERKQAIRNLPPDVRRKWYIKRWIIWATVTPSLFGAMLLTPKDPVILWGTVRILLFLTFPIWGYVWGRALPKNPAIN
nr:GIY-YIG nuclease family protein [Glycomyces amatae]